jgi:hypothetical protein
MAIREDRLRKRPFAQPIFTDCHPEAAQMAIWAADQKQI